MDSRKRKREQFGESSNSTKRLHLSLLKRFQRVRDISEILSDGANLETGHFCGILHAVEFKNQISTLMIQDHSKMILVCDITTRSPIYTLNNKLQKQIQVAVRNPKKKPMKEHKAQYYGQRLLFDEYQFLLDGELFEDTKDKGSPAWLPSDIDLSEFEPSSPEIPQSDEYPLRPQAKTIRTTKDIFTPIASKDRDTILSTPRPSTWTPIKDTLESNLQNKKVDIAGVVCSVTPARQVGASDWGIMIYLRDETCGDNQSLEVKLYAADKVHLPPLKGESHYGAILLVHGLKAGIDRRGNHMAVGYKGQWTYACFFDEASIDSADEAPPEVRDKDPMLVPDKTAIIGLRRLHHLSRTGFRQPEKLPSQNHGGCQLIEEFRDGGFYQCVVEVLHIWVDNHAEIYITDYTMNPFLTDPNTSKWWYPPGQRTLKITLFDSPKDQVHSLEVGSIYYLQNVRFQTNKGRAQGRCGSKGNNPNLIRKLSENHPDVMNLNRRKREFQHVDIPKSQRESMSSSKVDEQSKATKEVPEMATTLPQVTKEANIADDVAVVDPSSMKPQEVMAHIVDCVSILLSTEEYPSFPKVDGGLEPADTIECAKPDRHQLMSLGEIKTCGIVPALFRFRGRIVKVTPSDLNKATNPFCAACDNWCKVGNNGACMACSSPKKVEYRPALYLTFQDATSDLSVQVSDEFAVKFFRLSKATLHNEKATIEHLREQFNRLMSIDLKSNEYQVGGISDVFEAVLRNWDEMSEHGRQRYFALSSCRIRHET
ncbi:hypothetical protein CPB86DRAFT_875397 [Serendipita vermifera]|nr:hypothetical protein CPB86DRAFT_875397 [Serendipita vermifera]